VSGADVLDRALAPADEAELAAMVAEAFAGRRTLEVVGGGTRRGLGRPVGADATLSAARLSRVALYEPASLTLVVGAGARMADIDAMLAAEGQRLPFEPMDHRALYGSDGAPTIGGVVAGNLSGPRRVQVGACRDALLGVRFVDGRGTVVKNGGRVMKNVTGYDLVKLMAGSWGTLGVLTEVAFKLLPIPEAAATVILEGLDDATALTALRAALGSPFDVSGAAHLPGAPALTLVRVEGFAASVAYRADRLRALLARHGAASVETDRDAVAARWAAVRDAAALAARPGAVWRLSVKPTEAAGLVARLTAEGVAQGAAYDWGGGLVWLLTAETGDAGAAAVRREARAAGGHATLVRAPDAVRLATPPFHPEPAAVAALSEGVRARFDPARILNPGRMRA
jgi:glycolate oxidase FAD binding subunit